MDSKQRFSDRVDSYVKYRPSYPVEAIDYLFQGVGFVPDAIVADVGAGTGIFSKLLLERGSEVIAVEPNDAMREAANQSLHGFTKYSSICGSAEHTGLPDQSVDYIVCAQAFHWFNREAAKVEFSRILRPGGTTVLVWNSRRTSGTPFMEQYDQLLHKYGAEYAAVNHRNVTPELPRFFAEGGPQLATFTYVQLFDFTGLKGRLCSSSYTPKEGTPSYEPMIAGLHQLFERYQHHGFVTFEYETEVYWGKV